MSQIHHLDMTIPDEWTPTNTPPQTDLSPGDELIVHLEHTNDDHRLELIRENTTDYTIHWYAHAQSMQRNPTGHWACEQSHRLMSQAAVEHTLDILMNTITTMDNRAEHRVHYAMDGPYDY